MPALTRRRSSDQHLEVWRVYYGDVLVGTISQRSGVPSHVDQWSWSCGFYPGLEPGQQQSGTAPDFESARAGFEKAWDRLLPQLTDASFTEWRQSYAHHAWTRAMWDAGLELPTQVPEGRSRCFCGEPIDLQTTHQHVYARHMDQR